MSEEHADVNNAPLWRQEVSERLLTVERGFTEIKSDNAAIKQSLMDVVSAVKQLGADQRFDRKPFQWGVAISFAALVLGCAGAFTTLTITPIRDQQAANTAAIAILSHTDLENAKFQGQSEVWREMARREIDTLWAHAQQAETDHLSVIKDQAYIFGRQEAYEGRLDRLSQRLDAPHRAD